MANELLITDLRCALPVNAWTDTGCHAHDLRPLVQPAGQWQILDYRSVLYAGSMLRTSHADACELRIPLRRQGWHAISIGMINPWVQHTFVEVRLTGQEQWQRLEGFAPTRHELDTAASPLHEEPWIFADLTGRDLEVRYPADIGRARDAGGYCAICSVRAVPVAPEDLPVVKSRRHRRGVHFADELCFYDTRFDNPQWDVVCANNSVCGDVVSYPSQAGTPIAFDAWDIEPGKIGLMAGVRGMRDKLAAMAAQGVHPLQRLIAQAHDHGKRCWIATRPQAWATVPPYHHLHCSPFYAAHPEYRCVEADGQPLSKLSVAFPAVRERLNAVLNEALAWGADGVTILFNRGYPLVRYEAPVQARFRELFGLDVRQVPDSDPRLLQVWCEFVTAWIRELRRMLDAAGPSALGGRRELTIFTGPTLAWNLQFGIDVAAWAKAGLIDAVLPYPRHHHTARLYGQVIDRPDGWIDVAEYAAALAGTSVPLVPSLGHWGDHNMPLARLRERVHSFYDQGATGLCRWDAEPSLAAIQLDDPEIQRLWCTRYAPPAENLLLELGGLNLESFAPGIGY